MTNNQLEGTAASRIGKLESFEMIHRDPLAPISGSNRNRKFKRVALALFTAFMVLAPPGTLIVLSLFLIGIFGKAGVLILSGVALVAVAVLWLKRKAGQPTEKRAADDDPFK